MRPLSGRYLLKLAAGPRSLMWSPLVFGIDTISILDTPSLPLFVVGSGVLCPPIRPESAVTSQIRRRETPAAARFAGRGLLPSGGPPAGEGIGLETQAFLHCPVPTGGFPRVHGGVVESCVPTVDQPFFSSAGLSLLESCYLIAQGSSFLHFELVVLTLSHDCLTNPPFFTGDRFLTLDVSSCRYSCAAEHCLTPQTGPALLHSGEALAMRAGLRCGSSARRRRTRPVQQPSVDTTRPTSTSSSPVPPQIVRQLVDHGTVVGFGPGGRSPEHHKVSSSTREPSSTLLPQSSPSSTPGPSSTAREVTAFQANRPFTSG